MTFFLFIFRSFRDKKDKKGKDDSWDAQALTEIKQSNVPLSIHTSGGVFKG